MIRKTLVIVSFLSLPLFASASTDLRVKYVKDKLTAVGISQTSINKLFKDKRLHLYPVKSVTYKQPDWSIIENKLFSATYIQMGKNYIYANQSAFDSAEQKFGVSKEALAGVIAIESEFGKNTGTYPIFSILYSRLEYWPQTKWKAQAEELVALSKYCLAFGVDCYSIKGSYAGAAGIVQFMPSSLLAYGVDGNADGVINLSDPVDAIPSAANFLKAHGWASDPLKALTGYYGSPDGYPSIVLKYASLLKI